MRVRGSSESSSGSLPSGLMKIIIKTLEMTDLGGETSIFGLGFHPVY